ncbi:MAG: DMT family transporter [Pseudomonadota bacterium]
MATEISKEAPVARADDIAAGVAWMVVTGLFFVCVTGIVRYLGSNLPAAEGAFIRYAVGLLLVSPALVSALRRHMSPKVWALYGVRGAVHGVAVILWFYAMARIPMAEVTALGYTAPIFVTIGAALFLGERLRARRIIAVLIGLAGVLIILRPGFQEIGAGQIAQLVAAPLFAASFIIAKLLTSEARPTEIVAMLSLGCTLMLLPFALAEWRDPTWEEVFWLTMTAICATAGHYTLTKAYQCAPITVTQPVSFLQLVWATLLGVVMFAEPVDAFIVAGAAIIVGSAWYIARREMLAKRRVDTPAVGSPDVPTAPPDGPTDAAPDAAPDAATNAPVAASADARRSRGA